MCQTACLWSWLSQSARVWMLLSTWARALGGLLGAPLGQMELLWGVVPLYFGWVVNELTGSKASFGTAMQTGFALIWSGLHWIWQFQLHPGRGGLGQAAVQWSVTAAVLALGALSLVSGFRRRYPVGCRFLGHTRFSAWLMITLFPMQSGALHWTWDRLLAVLVFAAPVALLVHLILSPFRRSR